MSGARSSSAILDRVESQTDEGSEPQARQLIRPPGRKSAWERQELLRQVSDLKGRPFTAAFLAAATGVEVSEVVSTLFPPYSSAKRCNSSSLSQEGISSPQQGRVFSVVFKVTGILLFWIESDKVYTQYVAGIRNLSSKYQIALQDSFDEASPQS